MKIIILIENDLSCDPNLVNEFGFSVFIQDEDTSLIFDTCLLYTSDAADEL